MGTSGYNGRRFYPGSPHVGRQDRDAQRVGEVVASVVKAAGVGDRSALARLRQAWHEAVGREYALQTRLTGLSKGILTVEVDSAALGQELAVYHKRSLLQRLQETTGIRLVDLRCRLLGRRRREV